MEQRETHQHATIQAAPHREHSSLQQLVGEWTYAVQAAVVPGKPIQRWTGTERVRSLGELWVVAEGRSELPWRDDDDADDARL